MPPAFVAILIIGVPLVLCVYSILSVFYPRIRGNWRGNKQPIGTMSAVGMALFFNGIIVPAFVGHLLPLWLVPCYFVIIGTGMILTGLGCLRDSQAKK